MAGCSHLPVNAKHKPLNSILWQKSTGTSEVSDIPHKICASHASTALSHALGKKGKSCVLGFLNLIRSRTAKARRLMIKVCM